MFSKTGLAAVIGVAGALVIWVVLSSLAAGKYDAFAQCLTAKGVKMYGAYWCAHCENQKNAFGVSWRYINYIECSLPNRAGQTEFCTLTGIQGYPTWEFANGQRIAGEASFEQLSQRSGCLLEVKP